jgi:hypothetical protein
MGEFASTQPRASLARRPLTPANNLNDLTILALTPLDRVSWRIPLPATPTNQSTSRQDPIGGGGGVPSPHAVLRAFMRHSNLEPRTSKGANSTRAHKATLTPLQAPDTLFKFGDAAIFSAARPADLRRFHSRRDQTSGPDAVLLYAPRQHNPGSNARYGLSVRILRVSLCMQ